jgi:WD40 repeat protein
MSFLGHESIITSIICLRDNHSIVSSSDDGTVRFWSAYHGKILKKLEHNYASVNSLVITKGGK